MFFHPFLKNDIFQSTPSAWRETLVRKGSKSNQIFQSTPSAWRETTDATSFCKPLRHFNPLPPHGGRRAVPAVYRQRQINFNPLPPHGGRLSSIRVSPNSPLFQSTPSAWRETSCDYGTLNPTRFQSTPSAWRETGVMTLFTVCFVFQSTPSAWRETQRRRNQHKKLQISIHSLRMEGDLVGTCCLGVGCNFNPLPPHGGRRSEIVPYARPTLFQSTPSAWRETTVISGTCGV